MALSNGRGSASILSTWFAAFRWLYPGLSKEIGPLESPRASLHPVQRSQADGVWNEWRSWNMYIHMQYIYVYRYTLEKIYLRSVCFTMHFFKFSKDRTSLAENHTRSPFYRNKPAPCISQRICKTEGVSMQAVPQFKYSNCSLPGPLALRRVSPLRALFVGGSIGSKPKSKLKMCIVNHSQIAEHIPLM